MNYRVKFARAILLPEKYMTKTLFRRYNNAHIIGAASTLYFLVNTLEVLSTRVNVTTYGTMINQETVIKTYGYTKQLISLSLWNPINAIPWGHGAPTNNPEPASQQDTAKQSANRNSSMSGKVGIRNRTDTNVNMISSGGDGNDPEKYGKQKVKK